jgi:Holliday junction resolvase-like predicted endonuclease
MISKRIGNIGEAKVLSELVRFGIPVYIPFGDTEKADLIAEFNGKLNKIQVKTSEKAKDGYYEVDLRSCKNHKTTPETYHYTKTDIDYFATYNIERDVVCLIPITEAPKAAIILRYVDTKNNQANKVHLESDYLLEKIIKMPA